jgi:hypothetical protein
MREQQNKEGGGLVLQQAPTSVMKLDKVVKETQNKKVRVPRATTVKVGDKIRHVRIKNKPLNHNHNHTMKYAQNKEVFLSNFDLLNGRKSPTTPPIFSKTYSCDDHDEENIMIITIDFTKIRKLMRKMIKHGTQDMTKDMTKDLEKCIDICYKKETDAVRELKRVISNLLREILIEIIKIIVPTTDIKLIMKSFFPGIEKFIYNTFLHLVFQDLCKDKNIKKLCDKGLQTLVDRSRFQTKVAKLIVKNTILNKLTTTYLSHLKKKQKKIIDFMYEEIQDKLSRLKLKI